GPQRPVARTLSLLDAVPIYGVGGAVGVVLPLRVVRVVADLHVPLAGVHRRPGGRVELVGEHELGTTAAWFGLGHGGRGGRGRGDDQGAEYGEPGGTTCGWHGDGSPLRGRWRSAQLWRRPAPSALVTCAF